MLYLGKALQLNGVRHFTPVIPTIPLLADKNHSGERRALGALQE